MSVPEREGSEADLARWAKWDDLRARKEAATTDAERAALAEEEEALRQEGLKEVFFQEITENPDPTWWWLSFADGSLPEGEQFLGVAIVSGSGVLSAASVAKLLGCNPGGEVQGIEIPPQHVPPPEYRGRLLSRDELEEAGLA